MTRAPLPTGFGTLWVAVVVDLIGFGMVVPILPLYAERFDASPVVIGLLFASFSLAQFAASPLWGRLSDHIGRKPVLLTSLVGSAIGSLLTAFAPTMIVLFVGRLVDGASGGSVAVAHASAADLAAPEERPRLIGLLSAAYGIGFVVGPAFGGLAALVGTRAPFLLAAALATVNAIAAAGRLAETRDPRRPIERSIAVPRREIRSLVVAAFFATAAFGAFEVTFALLGARRLGLDSAATSGVFVAAGLLVAVTNTRGVAPVVGRIGARRAVRLGLLVDAAGLLFLAAAHTLPVLFAGIGLLSVGHGLAMPSLTTALAERAQPGHRGAALGAQQSANSLARIAGPLVAGAVFGAASPGFVFTGAAGLSLVAVLASRPSSTRETARPVRAAH